jgi:outer membrane protein assembly factor BamB
MRANLVGWALVAASLTLAGTVSAQSISTERSLPTRQQLSRHGLELAWWGQGVLNPSRDKVEHLTTDEDCVFVQSTSGIVTAFDAQTGQKRWAVQLGQFDPPSFPVVTNEDLAMVVIGTKMYGIDKITGRTLWQIRIPGQPSTSPAADDKHVYVGMLDGSMYAFDLRKIRQLYRENRLPEWSYQTISWRYMTSKEITSPPLIFNTRVCMASRDGNVYAVSAERRNLIFQFETDAPIVAPITRVDDLLFVTSEDFSFYALRVKPQTKEKKGAAIEDGLFVEETVKRDKESGKVVWEFTSGLPIRKAPYAIGPDVFILPDRGGFYSLSSHTGVQEWWQPQAVNYVAATGKRVYATDSDFNLLVMSRETGSVASVLPLRRFTKRFPNDRTDRIIVSTDSGLVMVLREKGRNIPSYHMYPDRLPILPEFASEDGDGPAEEMAPEGEMPEGEMKEGEMPNETESETEMKEDKEDEAKETKEDEAKDEAEEKTEEKEEK